MISLRSRVERNRVELWCFPLVTAVYAVDLGTSGINRFYADSQNYWDLSQTFDPHGHFSLFAYHDTLRGYSVPLLYHVEFVVSSWVGLGASVKAFGALLAATLGVVVAPRLARRLFPAASIGLISVLALNTLIFVFWRDHFAFPLSDFPALLAGSLGVLGLLRGRAIGYVGAGLAFGLASNMRPEYLPALLIAFVVAAALPPRPASPAARVGTVALVIAGAAIALLPQLLINHHQRGDWNPLAPGGRTIALVQLTDGLILQKYETYVGPAANYPESQVYYFDPSTIHVLEQEHISASLRPGHTERLKSYGQYAGIVARHPVEIAASYLRHIFNGIDVRYPTPYVKNLDDSPVVLSLLEYTLLFVALARLFLPEARRGLGRARWAGVVLLLCPCLSAIPGAVEARFFLPLQLLVYMLVCFGPVTRSSLTGGTISRRVTLAVAYVMFVLVCLTLSSSTLANIGHPGATLGLGAPPNRSAHRS